MDLFIARKGAGGRFEVAGDVMAAVQDPIRKNVVELAV
jgi:hypothetical protein